MPSKDKTILGFLLVFLLIAPIAPLLADSTFVLLYQKDGEEAEDAFGSSVASAGDVDGDGADDFIIGAPHFRSEMGSAYVYSGAAGSLFYQKNGEIYSSHMGRAVAGLGDVDGDVRSDFIIGAPDAPTGGGEGKIYVYSSPVLGARFPLYQRHGEGFPAQFGYSVAKIGDVNGDGKSDFIVGAYMASWEGSAYVYSGNDGLLLFQKDGTVAMAEFGYSVAGAGDVNRDGTPDYIIGAPHTVPYERPDTGSVYVYSGALAKVLLFKKDGAADSAQFGYSVAGAGDVNGDGWADFIVGAPSASPNGRHQSGSAYVYSGVRGSLLYQMDGDSADDFFGSSVAGAGDLDGDGKADFLIGAPNASRNGKNYAGSVYLYSGATGALLFHEDGAAGGDNFGFSLAAAGDVNGDGRPDIIIGAPYASPNGLSGAGSVYIYSRTCAAKGDMNADFSLTVADVTLMLHCVFLQEGICDFCFADVNCDGALAPADVVLELLAFILRSPLPC